MIVVYPSLALAGCVLFGSYRFALARTLCSWRAKASQHVIGVSEGSLKRSKKHKCSWNCIINTLSAPAVKPLESACLPVYEGCMHLSSHTQVVEFATMLVPCGTTWGYLGAILVPLVMSLVSWGPVLTKLDVILTLFDKSWERILMEFYSVHTHLASQWACGKCIFAKLYYL